MASATLFSAWPTPPPSSVTASAHTSIAAMGIFAPITTDQADRIVAKRGDIYQQRTSAPGAWRGSGMAGCGVFTP